jgi:predicted  nucleic acid-binding Zn-ribbon protein
VREEKRKDTGPCSIEEQYTEFVRLVNDVREDIPEIPEIKYYDEQISELSTTIEEVRESIPEVPEQRTYDEEIAAICGLIDELKEEVRTNAAEIPEIRYYDDQIERLETSLKSLPEIRHYEGDLTSIRDEIVLIKESIPVFPKWVNEVNEVPDFSWIGKQFSVIDDDFIKVADNANSIRDRITEEVRQLSEDLETKRFESKTEIKELTQNFTEVKEKIYEELRTAAVGILDIKHAFKNDDRLMKKQIMSKYNLLKLNVEEQIEKFNKTNEDTKDLYAGYFESLTEEISNLPKVKYYEEDIKNVREEFNKGLDSLKILVEDIRQKQKLAKDEIETIQEGLLNEPPENTQSVGTGDDPLAPLDKQFPNLKALADHYRLFINRTQQQLAVIGGGGAGFVPDLADVDFDIATGTDKILVYNADRNGTKFVGIGSTSLINVVTGNLEVTGNISCAGTVTYDDVTFVDSIGVVTARTGIELGAGSITPVISFEAATETTTTTSASTIDTFAAATYRSAQYQIQITQGSNYHVTTLNVLHDGSQVYIMEFGTVRTGVALATFDADISSGNVRVRGTPTTSLSTVFKLSKVLTRV